MKMSEPDRMASTPLFTYLTQGVICDHQREPGGVAASKPGVISIFPQMETH